MSKADQLSDWERASEETSRALGYSLGNYPLVDALYWGFFGILGMMAAMFLADILTVYSQNFYGATDEVFFTKVALFFGAIGGVRAWLRNRKWEAMFSRILERLVRERQASDMGSGRAH